MSCSRCQHRPCSCPNANCGCPPDYSFNPATLTCEGGTPCENTMQTACIFSTIYLSCTRQAIGTDLQTILTAMDAKICQCGSCSGGTGPIMSEYYVNSLNTVTGDGSAINPFQTMEEAYNKIIGAGTVSNPDNPFVTVKVLGGTYTTELNIYIPDTRWNFFPSTQVTLTGDGYFIDSSVVSDGANPFIVTGFLEFYTATGGFIKNEGSHIVGSTNKHIYVEATSVWGSTPKAAKPLINHHLTYGTIGTEPIITSIKLQGSPSTSLQHRIPSIISANETTIASTGGILNIDLGNGELGFGIDPVSGANTGTTAGFNLYYNNPDSTTFKQVNCELNLINGYIWGQGNEDLIYMTGVFTIFNIENIKTKTYGGTIPLKFLNVGDIIIPDITNYWNFILKDVIIDNVSLTGFSGATTAGLSPVVVDYTGITPQSLLYLNMQNCIIYQGRTVNFNFIIPGRITLANQTVSTINIFDGNMNILGLDFFDNQSQALIGGKVRGDVYTQSTFGTLPGALMAVY